MKKIMFNDRYGLTQAVLDGRKTMTRRVAYDGEFENPHVEFNTKDCEPSLWNGSKLIATPKYKIGEVVAVAQSYKDCGYDPNMLQQTFVPKPTIFPDLDPHQPLQWWVDLPLKYHKGWNNKMFVINGLMPHQIKFTDIKAERLQDISDEDCLKEGINEDLKGVQYSFDSKIGYCGQFPFATARHAFASLIDKVSGKCTWERNPWVFAYTFELVK